MRIDQEWSVNNLAEWLDRFSFAQKLRAGFFTVIGLFSLIILLIALTSDFHLLIALILIAVLIGISIPFISFLERTLTSSFQTISRVALDISKGDFTHRMEVDSKDALGEVGDAFNKMIERLREILNETSTLSKLVSESSRNMYYKNQSMKEVIAQVTQSTNELAIGANEITENVSNISTSIKEIEGKVSTYAESTREMNKRSEQMLELVEAGLKAVESQSSGMKNNVEAAKAVTVTVNELAKQAEGISKITRTISEIAEQTNLLSLNASIEAARAGEHGRGFAVVAQEVRELAVESSESAKEVFALVKNIELGIENALRHIRRNEEIVALQNQYIEETNRVFTEIVNSIRFITDQIRDFAAQSEQMLENARSISSAMENISAIIQQAAAGTEEVSASMNEQMESVQEMLTHSEQMMQRASQLQQTIGIFKV